MAPRENWPGALRDANVDVGTHMASKYIIWGPEDAGALGYEFYDHGGWTNRSVCAIAQAVVGNPQVLRLRLLLFINCCTRRCYFSVFLPTG